MLTIGNSYALTLVNPWKELTYDCVLLAITDYNEMNNFGSNISIRGTYFTPYGLGLGEYASYVENGSAIYIFQRILTRNPPTLEQIPSLFLAAAMIDENATVDLVTANDYTFSITGLSRYLSPLAEQTFLAQTMVDLQKAVNNVPEMIGYPIAVSVASATDVYEKPFLDAAEAKREDRLSQLNAVLIQDNADYNARIAKLYEELTELNSQIIQQELLNKTLLKQLNDIAGLQNENLLVTGRIEIAIGNLQYILAKLNTQYGPGTTYDNPVLTLAELYNEAYQASQGDGGHPNGTVPTPTIDNNGGTFTHSQLVHLHCSLPSATIAYTLDLSDPDTSDTAIIYNPNQGISIVFNCNVRFYAYANGYAPSPMVSSNGFSFTVVT